MKFVLQQIADLADAELYDEVTVRDQLLLLQVQLEDGDIDEDEYREREIELMQRLREIRARLHEQQVEDLPAEADVTARRRAVIEIEAPFDES